MALDPIVIHDESQALGATPQTLAAEAINGNKYQYILLANSTGTITDPLPQETYASGNLGVLNDVVQLNTYGASLVHCEIAGTFVATYIFEGSLDGTNWTSLKAWAGSPDYKVGPYTTNSSVTSYRILCPAYRYVRVRASAYTSGTVNVRLNAPSTAQFLHSEEPPIISETSANITAVSQTSATFTKSWGSVIIEVRGTWVGTLELEATTDNANWFSIRGMVDASSLTTLTSNAAIFVNNAGYSQIRLRSSAWTSGTATIRWTYHALSRIVGVGGGRVDARPSDGTNSLTMLNTAPASTDYGMPTRNIPSNYSTYSGSVGATVTSVKASAGTLHGWYIYNANASAVYVQIFDLATGSVTLGTTAPKMSFGIPPTAGANEEMSNGIAYATAISYAVTTTRAGATGPGSTVDVNFLYR